MKTSGVIFCLFAAAAIGLTNCHGAPGATTNATIAAGNSHTCAILSNGSIKCWGNNSLGQLGSGSNAGPEICVNDIDTNCSTVPISVLEITNAITIAAGHEYTCAVLSGGSIKCWGYGGSGNLGNGSWESSSTPVSVSEINNAINVATSSGSVDARHTCATLSNGSIKCWGNNIYGQLGIGNNTGPETCTGIEGMGGCSTLPVSVKGITNAVAVATGAEHSCALLSDGSIKCWGDNFYGQLGINYSTRPEICVISNISDEVCSTIPISVAGITNAIAITAGWYHTCALLSDKTIKCWGKNVAGWLENNPEPPRPCGYSDTPLCDTPISVADITNAIAIDAGCSSTCAILSDRSIKCWNGYNSTDTSFIPVSITDITNAATITVGVGHVCALLSSSKMMCWGNNDYGQLGNGSATYSSTPISVTGL